jgi:hemerythrin
MLKWSEEFATGVQVVDSQHRTLINKINELEELLKAPTLSKPACDELLAFLNSYAASHFRLEEDCMARHRCPAHEKNKLAHKAFLGVFARFRDRYVSEGPSHELLRNLHAATSDWIQYHILTVDIALRTCVSELASR